MTSFNKVIVICSETNHNIVRYGLLFISISIYLIQCSHSQTIRCEHLQH
jgi:hypothetical protein